MELYAAGNNAWRQLTFAPAADDGDEPADLPAFVRVLADDDDDDEDDPAALAVLHAGRASTLGTCCRPS